MTCDSYLYLFTDFFYEQTRVSLIIVCKIDASTHNNFARFIGFCYQFKLYDYKEVTDNFSVGHFSPLPATLMGGNLKAGTLKLDGS